MRSGHEMIKEPAFEKVPMMTERRRKVVPASIKNKVAINHIEERDYVLSFQVENAWYNAWHNRKLLSEL